MNWLNFLKLYGTRGRIVSACGVIVIIVTSLQVGGAFDLLPPKLVTVLLVCSGVAVALSERIQGGASKPEIRIAAEKADQKKAMAELNK